MPAIAQAAFPHEDPCPVPGRAAGPEAGRALARAEDCLLPDDRRPDHPGGREPALRGFAHSHKRRRNAARMVARAPAASRPGGLLAWQWRKSLPLDGRRRRAATTGVQRAGGGLPGLRAQHRDAQRAGHLPRRRGRGARVRAPVPAPRHPRRLLGPLAWIAGRGVEHRGRASRRGRARESDAERALGGARQPGPAALQLLLVLHVRNVAIPRPLRRAAARHSRRCRQHRPLQRGSAGVQGRAGGERRVRHDSRRGSQRSARGQARPGTGRRSIDSWRRSARTASDGR